MAQLFDAAQAGPVSSARSVSGKSPQDFVRDAALKAADDLFLKALDRTRDHVPQFAEVFAAQDARAADTSTEACPDR
ncbi:hypothetical protein AB0N07_33520 [Streptomyces sp. NPDC051172]|uniref:hypothetical protein n=1 Tax=Streptomyces sp. NPDC051172 TaxID=3155796 RepID=UPI0034295EB3